METINSSTGIVGAVDSRIGGREENQDDFGYTDTHMGFLVVVCDGMGGGPSGKTASSMARSSIISYINNCPANADPSDMLTQAVVAANDAVYGATQSNHALMGMGTTCVAALIQGGKAYVAHVGDSRCYLLHKGKKVFRTNDHSYVAELVRAGRFTEEQARLSNHSNIITRAVGTQAKVEPELDVVRIKPGDRLALMSDGIWGTMPEEHLVKFLCAEDELSMTVTELADRVDAMGHNNGGHHDNLTLAMVSMPKDAKGARWKPHFLSRWL